MTIRDSLNAKGGNSHIINLKTLTLGGTKQMSNDKPIQYGEVAQSEKFKKLIGSKKRFIIPMTVFFLLFYFTLPILTSYTKILNNPAIGPISWAWVYAFAQFLMTWALCIIYSRKSKEFDRQIEEIKSEIGGNSL